MKRRVFQNPDGTVRIMVPNPKRMTDSKEDFDVVTARDPTLDGLPFQDIDGADIPTDRGLRYKWRLNQGKVKVDPSVPDFVPPRRL